MYVCPQRGGKTPAEAADLDVEFLMSDLGAEHRPDQAERDPVPLKNLIERQNRWLVVRDHKVDLCLVGPGKCRCRPWSPDASG